MGERPSSRDGGDSGDFVRAFGRYVDELVREPDGRWRFVERIAEAVAVDPDDQD